MDTRQSAWCKGGVAVLFRGKVRRRIERRRSGGGESGPGEALGPGGRVGREESGCASGGAVLRRAHGGVVVDVLGHGLVAGPRRSADPGLSVCVVEEEGQDVL